MALRDGVDVFVVVVLVHAGSQQFLRQETQYQGGPETPIEEDVEFCRDKVVVWRVELVKRRLIQVKWQIQNIEEGIKCTFN